MTQSALLERIRSTPWIADLLAWFDFDIEGVPYGPVEPVHLASGEPLEMIASDGSGGAYMLVGVGGDERPMVYVCSEGEGGLIATNLRDALALVVGMPSVHDAMARPFGDDDGAQLRAWLAELDEEIREHRPELDADRARLREALDLPRADGLLAALHAAAADEAYRPISDEGYRYDSMLR